MARIGKANDSLPMRLEHHLGRDGTAGVPSAVDLGILVRIRNSNRSRCHIRQPFVGGSDPCVGKDSRCNSDKSRCGCMYIKQDLARQTRLFKLTVRSNCPAPCGLAPWVFCFGSFLPRLQEQSIPAQAWIYRELIYTPILCRLITEKCR